MFKLKKMFSLLTIMLFLLINTGLSAGGQQEVVSEPEPETMVSETLTLWIYDSGWIDTLTEIGKQFEDEYGIAVEVALVELGQINNQFLLASGGEECADMAIIPHDNLGALVVNDAVMEFDLGNKTDKFLAPAVDGFMYNGKLFGLPLAVENIGFFRNTELVPEAPQTWDEVYTIGKALVQSGKADYIMGFPDATYNVFPVYTSGGGYIFGKDASGVLDPKDIGMAGNGFVEGLKWLTKLVDEGLAPEAIDWDGAHVLFESGRAPFICTGPWALNRFNTEGIPYAISAFPSNGAPFLGVKGLIISSASPNAMLAQVFATEYLATETNMQALFDAEERPSAWNDIFINTESVNLAGFNAAGANAIPMPSIPEMGYVWDAWVSAAALSFSGELSPQAALENAVVQIRTQTE